MTFSQRFNAIFDRTVEDYHKSDNVDALIHNPYEKNTLDNMLYQKNWIDSVQWHLEDIIRDPDIDPVKALEIKRRIDRSNQERTDLVEQIDQYFIDIYRNVKVKDKAGLNTETPAWAIDRLSILALKIYHMREESLRRDAEPGHITRCSEKLQKLLSQREDLSGAIDSLLDEIASGAKMIKSYRQMKMYNDPSLNPVLYSGGKK
ncbi:MAG: DUF4254 domain-containing protein [Bacteroidales bacterium]|nr:DUF4254 domain-containing protein [Bacteroidales bacterium]MDD2425981.1 DUF4254 domain-containing protein [Bacteroidales bacterium]MDD3990216.1 DUF4254 domain-containing protein [Bacteroidales bacterium]MDD4639121.1 DUF4254 domain-containing protein [Bacteroidales bacterium]